MPRSTPAVRRRDLHGDAGARPDPQSVVHACARLVKPGGQVFFSTINRNGKAWLMAVVGAEYVMKMVPKGTHDVKKFIKPAELLGWVDQTTLKEQHIIGLHYNPLTNTFKLAPGLMLTICCIQPRKGMTSAPALMMIARHQAA
jgi:2-polyprenyl-6-hydroxyphenyl methylase/3-demethylubiquinone-9 3-methyltransferase